VKKNLIALVGIAVGAAGALAVSPALADVQYLLSVGNAAIAGYAGPYGIADVHLNSSTLATITFTSDPSYYFVDGGSVAVNVNAASWTLGPITGNALAGNSIYSDGGSGNEDGLGSFNQRIDSGNTGPTHRSTTISFTLTDNDIGGWASEASVLGKDASGEFVAAHIGVCNLSPAACTNDATLLATGFAAGGVGTPTTLGGVPEPSTWAMLGLGFACLGYAGFRRSKRESISAIA